jgi:hypothetical protein
MSVDDVRRRARDELSEVVSMEAADYLLDRPPGGWSTLATKQDLERFATKDDLERFATKQDLERFATKQDLERFATKDDLERFATKQDIDVLDARFENLDEKIDDRFDFLNGRLDDKLAAVELQIKNMGDVLRLEMHKTLQIHTWRLAGGMITLLGLLIAAIKI